MKDKILAAIDNAREEIIEIGDYVLENPEMGYKEYKTAELVKNVFEKLGINYRDNLALTGVKGELCGNGEGPNICIIGEMDAVKCFGHPYADSDTGAAHACGHNAQIASMLGAAIGIVKSGIMEKLGGKVTFFAVPAEEFVELEYRNKLREEGKISFLGGKQEFVKLGVMDDVDVMVMQHTDAFGDAQIQANAGGPANGFVGKLVNYIGKEAHAGGAPHMGINALNAAELGMMAIHANRETFRDEDHIRVHPIITKGGDLVNIVPSDVRIETYVRGARTEAILDASMKVNRSLEAGAYAVGAQCKITELPGYLPVLPYPPLAKLMCNNLGEIMGHDRVEQVAGSSGGSTDAGDISHLMPTVHAYIGGAKGGAHCPDYEIEDKEMAYITSAKALIMTAIDLLAEGAETGLEIKAGFKPALTKETYLRDWGHL